MENKKSPTGNKNTVKTFTNTTHHRRNIQTLENNSDREGGREGERIYINNSSTPITKKVSRRRPGSHKAPHIIPFIQSPPHHLPPKRPRRPNHQHARRPHWRSWPQIHRRSAASHPRQNCSFLEAIRGQFGRSERGWKDSAGKEAGAPRERGGAGPGVAALWVETASRGQVCWKLQRHCRGKKRILLAFSCILGKKERRRRGTMDVELATSSLQVDDANCQIRCWASAHLKAQNFSLSN